MRQIGQRNPHVEHFDGLCRYFNAAMASPGDGRTSLIAAECNAVPTDTPLARLSRPLSAWPYGRSTLSITWITPFVAIRSAVVTLASLTRTETPNLFVVPTTRTVLPWTVPTSMR